MPNRPQCPAVSMPSGLHVASGLARVGVRSTPSPGATALPLNRAVRFWVCFAAQREQARSPQGLMVPWQLSARWVALLIVAQRAVMPSGLHVASGLARVGVRSTPRPGATVSLLNRAVRFRGCFAPQREQARSPQDLVVPWHLSARWVALPIVAQRTVMPSGLHVASGLARVGVRSAPSPGATVSLLNRAVRFWGCFAAQREQARSPQGLGVPWHLSARWVALPIVAQRTVMPSGLHVASGLARVGVRSAPSPGATESLLNRAVRFWGCFAAQREQARSPQG